MPSTVWKMVSSEASWKQRDSLEVHYSRPEEGWWLMTGTQETVATEIERIRWDLAYITLNKQQWMRSWRMPERNGTLLGIKREDDSGLAHPKRLWDFIAVLHPLVSYPFPAPAVALWRHEGWQSVPFPACISSFSCQLSSPSCIKPHAIRTFSRKMFLLFPPNQELIFSAFLLQNNTGLVS